MEPDLVDLARLQFALTAGAHFLFVALTLGLATLVACIQTRATISRSPVHARMTRFWGQLYVINYAMGIVTGLVMEFQFGLSWSGLTHFAGNVFGASLAMETLVAFFIESTFLGLWIFGWDRLNRWAHLALIWVVTLTAYASAYWILVSNGFLQNPVGYELDGESLRLTDAAAVLTNPTAITAFWHVLGAALVTAGFFMAGVSAYHLFRRTPVSCGTPAPRRTGQAGKARTTQHAPSSDREFFRRSLRIGVYTTLPALMFTAAWGGIQFGAAGDANPMKLAVFNNDEAEIARLQAEMVARFGPGDYSPPAGWVQAGGTVMLSLFGLMLILSAINVLLALFRPVVLRFRLWHLLLIGAIPLPFLAMISGWIFREVGRQPWVVNGLLKTADAVSPVSTGAMRASLITFTVLFGLLILTNYWLLARHARRGPEAVALGRPEPETKPEPVPVATF